MKSFTTASILTAVTFSGSALAQEPAPPPRAPAPVEAPAPAEPPGPAQAPMPPQAPAPTEDAPLVEGDAPAPAEGTGPTPPVAVEEPPAPHADAQPDEPPAPHALREPERPAVQAGSGELGPPQKPQNLDEYLSKGDRLQYPGYIPGYREYQMLGLSPVSPATQPPVAGMPSYGAPTLTEEWSFHWSGYMTASLQFSLDERPDPVDGQSRLVVNTPPSTVDEWWSFLGTGTVPGNWVGMDFVYGNKYVTANVSIDTWQPSNPSTYYQLGAQYFINKSFLRFTPEPIAGIRPYWNVGYFHVGFGQLGKWSGGLYSNNITAVLTGVGESLYAEYDVSSDWSVNAEHGVMTDRQGRAPDGLVSTDETRWVSPFRGAPWIHHAHLGVTRRGNPEARLKLHHVYTWTQDDRTAALVDNPDTRGIDESRPPDASMSIHGFTLQLESPSLGFLGVAASYSRGDQVWQLRGVRGYGGDGEDLTKRYWGENTGGTGTMFVGAVNYAFTIAQLAAHPEQAPGDIPDVTINTGFHLVHTTTDNVVFDGRVRYKYGADVNYQFSEYVGVALRGDSVSPNSKDSDEHFYVLAPRITFRTHWYAHEQISLRYAKWFYGPNTRTEATGDRSISRIDDQLVALNFNMYW